MLLGDMGQGFGFRAGVFDGAISVSALQWLCYSDRRDHRAARRLEAFFTALYRALRRGARCVQGRGRGKGDSEARSRTLRAHPTHAPTSHPPHTQSGAAILS